MGNGERRRVRSKGWRREGQKENEGGRTGRERRGKEEVGHLQFTALITLIKTQISVFQNSLHLTQMLKSELYIGHDTFSSYL